MADKKSGFELLYNKVIGITFFSLLIVGSCGLFLWQSYQQDKAISEQYLPALERQQQLSVLLEEADEAISELQQKHSEFSFANRHLSLEEKLNDIKKISGFGRSYFPFLNDDELDNLVSRITNNEARNATITDDALVLINYVNHSMIDLIAVMSDRQANLYNQVLADKVSDRVTASRAIAHTNVSHDIQAYQDANRHINQVADTLSQLTYLSSINEIDELELHAEKFGQWQGVYQDQLQAENDELANHLNALSNNLFGEIRLIAKWRGHIRVSHDYLDKLVQQNEKLKKVEDINKRPIDKPILGLAKLIEQFGVSLTQLHLYLGLVAIVSLSLCIIFLLLSGMLKRVKQTDEKTQQLVTTLVSKCEEQDAAISIETHTQQTILEKLNHVFQPEHDEVAYQSLLGEFQDLLDGLIGHDVITILHAKKNPILDVEQQHLNWFNKLANCDHQLSQLNSWRRLFTQAQCHEILEKLRGLTPDNRVQVNVKFDESHQITIKFSVVNGKLFTLAYNSSAQLLQESEFTGSVEQFAQAQQKQWLGEQKLFSHIQQQLIRSHLSQQSIKRSDRTSLKLGQQLNQLIEWSEGGRLWAQTHIDDTHLSLTAVDLSQAIAAHVYNAQLKAGADKHISFEHLTSEQLGLSTINVLLDLPTYHYVIAYLIEAQYTQQPGDLALSTHIVDQNAGQLVIRYQFNYQQKEALSAIPPAMLLVSHQLEKQPKTLTFDQAYFARSLLTDLHADNIELIQESQGWQFAFDLPHATPDNVEKLKAQWELPKLGTRVVVIVKEEANRQWLDALLKPVCSDVIAVSSLEHAQSFFEVSRLEKQKIGLVISANEQGHHDAHQINTLIKQLPERLMPKFFILNDAPQLPQSQYDTYSFNINMKLAAYLLTELNRFLSSKAQHNLSYQHDQIQSIDTVNTNIKVLVAVEDTVKHQPLASLLSWLGLNVTIVSSSAEAQNQWGCGLHRVLVTDMALADIDQLAHHKKVKRLVVSLSEHSFNSTDVIETKQLSLSSTAEQWVELLKPWLAVKSVKQPELAKQKLAAPTKPVTDEKAQVEPVEVSFDIEKYAQNMGGPELAALMVDDYMDQLTTTCEQLKYALAVKSTDNAKQQAQTLQKVSQIIASKALYAWSEQLLHCIEHQAFNDAHRLMPEVERDIKGLVAFAEAI